MFTRGDQREPGFVQHRAGERTQVPASGEQPCVERRRGTELHAFEQIVAEAVERDGVGPSPVAQHVDVDGLVVQPQLDRIAEQRVRVTEQPAQLGEVPSERRHRIVGLAEQQPGEALPRWAAVRRARDRRAEPTPCVLWAGRPVRRRVGRRSAARASVTSTSISSASAAIMPFLDRHPGWKRAP